MHIMLDIETMGKDPDAAMVSIGAVRFTFDEETKPNPFNDTFYQVVNLKSAQRAGGKLDAETVMFWMGQPDKVRNAFLGDGSAIIDAVLKDFAEWVRRKPLEGMWGNGADFDNVILKGAYERSGRLAPWNYYENRCYRTLKSLFPAIEKEVNNMLHHAMYDAITQAKHLCKIMKRLKPGS